MTNEGAIAYFEILLEKQEGKFAREWLREAIAALKAEPCEDAISRQAMLDGLASIARAKAKSDAQKSLMGRVMFFTEQLPPVTPKPRSGKIIMGGYDCDHYICFECGHDFGWFSKPDYKYCPNCGAKME